MSDGQLIPRPVKLEEPFLRRFGIRAHYGLDYPISTSVSEGGGGEASSGWHLGASLDIAENWKERITFSFDYSKLTTDGKLFPSDSGEGSTFERNSESKQIGFGYIERITPLVDKGNKVFGALSYGILPLIGIGENSMSQSGEDSEQKAPTQNIGTLYSLSAEFRPWGRGPAFSVGPAFYYGGESAGSGAENSRLKLSAMLMLDVGYYDASTAPGTDADTELSGLGIAQSFYRIGHGWLFREALNETLADLEQALALYKLSGDGGGDRGSTADIPILESVAALAAGLSSSLTPALHAGDGWFWAFVGALGLRGANFTSSGSEAGQVGGTADLFGTARLVSHAIAGIETPAKRRTLPDQEVKSKEAYIGVANYLAGLGATTLLDNNIAMIAGASANVQLTLDPDAIGSGIIERTDIGLALNDRRSGLVVHHCFRDLPKNNLQLFAETIWLSPIGRDDKEPNSDINAILGLEWMPTDTTRLSLGPYTAATFGGGEEKEVAVGGMAGLDFLLLGKGGSGVVAGVRCLAGKALPKNSWQTECIPNIGATIRR